MTPDIIAQMKAEQADLRRKLEAIQAVLAAYGVTDTAAPATTARTGALLATTSKVPPLRERVPLSRFSEYGAQVVNAALHVVQARSSGPVLTRDLVAEIEKMGIEIRGNDKVNALSALLARSADLVSHGRRGWTASEDADARLDALLGELKAQHQRVTASREQDSSSEEEPNADLNDEEAANIFR